MNLKNLKVSKVSYESVLQAKTETSSGMSTFSVKEYENNTSTAAKAPYLVRIIADGEWSLDDQALLAAERLDCTFEQARYYWSALMEMVAEVLTDGSHTAVDFGYWRFELAVEGSVPSANPPASRPSANTSKSQATCRRAFRRSVPRALRSARTTRSR